MGRCRDCDEHAESPEKLKHRRDCPIARILLLSQRREILVEGPNRHFGHVSCVTSVVMNHQDGRSFMYHGDVQHL